MEGIYYCSDVPHVIIVQQAGSKITF